MNIGRVSSSYHKGQTMIEIVVAVGIIAIVLVGVSDLITRSMSLSGFQGKKNGAENIAQNQINYYRQQKDLNPESFFAETHTSDPCVGDIDSKIYTSCVINYEMISVAGRNVGANMKVTLVWSDGDKTINTSLSESLSRPLK